MTSSTKAPTARPKRTRTKATQRLSPDGRWKSFSKVPHLLQYTSTSVYYARVRVGGKLVRRSLQTTVYSDALQRLGDFVKEQRESPPRSELAPITFAEARVRFEEQLETRHDLKPRAREYRQGCIKVLLKTWPDLDEMKLKRITETACNEWAKRFLDAGYDEHYFNQTLSTLRQILDCGEVSSNPAAKVKRRGVHLKELKLPEPQQFEALLENMEQGGGGHSRNAADLVRFLAFSGCRLSEARQVTWADVDLKQGHLWVENAKQRLTSLGAARRKVPIIQDMRQLLQRLKKSNPCPDDTVCKVHECQKSMTRACGELDLARLTHHDLRHLFATRCIESGVDVPTVSRWLGHRDGGALAMKVYGLRGAVQTRLTRDSLQMGAGEVTDALDHLVHRIEHLLQPQPASSLEQSSDDANPFSALLSLLKGLFSWLAGTHARQPDIFDLCPDTNLESVARSLAILQAAQPTTIVNQTLKTAS